MKQRGPTARVMLIGIGVAMVLLAVGTMTVNAGLIAHWKLDETGGVSAEDSSVNTHNGTLRAGPVWDPGGVANGAVAFDGLNDHITVPDSPDLKYTGGDMTLSAWVYLDAAETSGYILSKPWHGSGGYNYRIQFTGTTSTTLNFYMYALGTGSRAVYSPAYPSFREAWHHVAAVADSSRQMKLYVDGSLVNETTHSIMNWPTTGDLNLSLALGAVYPYGGGWSGHAGNALDGKLDDVAIFDSTETAEQIALIHGLGRYSHVDLDDSSLDDVLTVFTSAGGSAMAGNLTWSYATGLPGVLGASGIHQGEFFITLDDSGNGVTGVPEPSTLIMLLLGTAGLFASGRRRRR